MFSRILETELVNIFLELVNNVRPFCFLNYRPHARNGENGTFWPENCGVGPELCMENPAQPRCPIQDQGCWPKTAERSPLVPTPLSREVRERNRHTTFRSWRTPSPGNTLVQIPACAPLCLVKLLPCSAPALARQSVMSGFPFLVFWAPGGRLLMDDEFNINP